MQATLIMVQHSCPVYKKMLLESQPTKHAFHRNTTALRNRSMCMCVHMEKKRELEGKENQEKIKHKM